MVVGNCFKFHLLGGFVKSCVFWGTVRFSAFFSWMWLLKLVNSEGVIWIPIRRHTCEYYVYTYMYIYTSYPCVPCKVTSFKYIVCPCYTYSTLLHLALFFLVPKASLNMGFTSMYCNNPSPIDPMGVPASQGAPSSAATALRQRLGTVTPEDAENPWQERGPVSPVGRKRMDQKVGEWNQKSDGSGRILRASYGEKIEGFYGYIICIYIYIIYIYYMYELFWVTVYFCWHRHEGQPIFVISSVWLFRDDLSCMISEKKCKLI